MRILIVDTYYPGFLADFRRRRPHIEERPYEEHHALLMAESFGTGDAYARELRALGHEGWTVVMNAAALQARWAKEHGVSVAGSGKAAMAGILLAQVHALRPDVVVVQELSGADDDVWREVRALTRRIVGQIACTLPAHRTFAHHDLILSSWLPIVDHFRAMGRRAAFLPLGFDAAVLDGVGITRKTKGVTFVGGLASVHGDRVRLLEALCRELPLEVYGYGCETLPPDSPIRSRHRGEVWGLEMFRILGESWVTINVHGDIVVGGVQRTDLANNCRLFEATGAGAALVTDAKANLADYFTPGLELLAYTSVAECVDQCRSLLARPEACERLARAGQARTLRDHTYAQRMRVLAEILADLLHS